MDVKRVGAQMTHKEWTDDCDWWRERTRAKLRYARLLWEEMRNHQELGDDFDYAHEEGCLSHLDGAIDAFLQEINACHKLGLDPRRVKARFVAEELNKRTIGCPEFDLLQRLLGDEHSWLGESREYRNQAIHRSTVSRAYTWNLGDGSKSVEYRHRKTLVVRKGDRLDVLSAWIEEAIKLFEGLGSTLRAASGLPPI